MEYKSAAGETFTEKTIEKSRFISYISHVESEEAAKAFLSRLRALHPLATHVCYGYIADKIGNLQRFSDDGEPQGTAGLPILGVLKARGLFETAIGIVRYFGGIKLGAGGLTRAYAGSAADVCNAAEIKTYSTGVEITLEVDYPLVNAAMKFLEGETILQRGFGSAASFTVLVREQDEAGFYVRAREFLNGKVRFSRGKSGFYPF